LAVLLTACAAKPGVDVDDDVLDAVNPFIGTDGTGHTFPGPVMPFGMVQPGPDNRSTGWDYTSGYQYTDTQILGFSQTRISGAGIPEFGDVLLLPFVSLDNPLAGATYDKATEQARPGYYAVTLAEDAIQVELTATDKVAYHRYTFPESGRVRVLIDLQHGLTFGTRERVTDSRSTVDTQSVTGSVHSDNWVKREMHFALMFDAPVIAHETLPRQTGERAERYVLSFNLPQGTRTLQARAAVSTVSIAGARGNLATSPSWDFDAVVGEAQSAWRALLSRIRIDTDPRTRRMFYSALYRALIHPSDIADADGRVRGPDGEVTLAPDGVYYSTFSLWDTFRASHPLFTIVVPERVDGFVASMLAHEAAAGVLPLWTAFGRETWTMIGNPAMPVIADAIAKGFDGFDHNEALEAMARTATTPHKHSDWSVLDRYGYYPTDKVTTESVSMTLEAGIGDAALARVATALGDSDRSTEFGKRALSYRNLFDTATGHLRGRDSAGTFREPFDPLEATSPLNNPGDYTEANAWQYLWTPALYDVDGLIELLGGKTAFTEKLDEFFATQGNVEARFLGQEALIGQYAHGNEPSHHVAWLYAYSNTPERASDRVRDITTRFYADTPDGIIGNDDAGQMSAWYVMAMLGLYPVDPASGHYVVIASSLDAAVLAMPGAKEIDLKARLALTRAGAAAAIDVPHGSLFSPVND
ncbi:MAG: GH92 family glycosyl hydrolase, partial [Pseudomonadota bacterium]